MFWPSTVAIGCLVLGASDFWATAVAASKTEKRNRAGILKRLIVDGVYTGMARAKHKKLSDISSEFVECSCPESCREVATFAELTHRARTTKLDKSCVCCG